MPSASHLQLLRKEKKKNRRDAHEWRRMKEGKKRRGSAQTTPSPPRENKTENRWRYPSGRSRYLHIALLTFLCLPPPSSRALFLPFPPSWLPSLASLPLSHALSHPSSPSPRSGSDPRRPPLRPPAGTEGQGPAGRRALSSADLALPPRPLSPSTLPAVHLEYLGFLNGVSRIRSPRLPLAVG